MDFYAYKGNYNLNEEPIGGDCRIIIKNKTRLTAVRRCKSLWGNDFTLYSFTNFYDDKTFRKIY